MSRKHDADMHVQEDLPSTISTNTLELIKVLDPAAWDRTIRRYNQMLFCWCRRSGLKAHDAEDVCQDVLRSASTSIHRFRRATPQDTFRGWLRRITQRRISDFRSSRKSLPYSMGGEGNQGLLNSIKALEISQDVDSASPTPKYSSKLVDIVRSEFEPKSWDAFWRTTVEEEDSENVAKALGITRNAVYLAKSRILKRFRQVALELQDVSQEPPSTYSILE